MTERDRVFTKCAWRLVPFMMLLYLVNYIDRSNVGFAALTMNRYLGLSPSGFGFASGVFFVGYVLCQVPATVILERVGARRAVFCIMLAWGLISASTAFVTGAHGLYALRFLLGVAEAGFFPGMIFYLTLWFPKLLRARYSAAFSSAIPLAGIIGGPLSGVILGLDGVAGLHGWQWLFLIQGLPASLLAIVVLLYMPDDPAHARWLARPEKRIIAASLSPDAASDERNLRKGLRDPRAWALGSAGFAVGSTLFATSFWLPQIIHGMGFSNLGTGFLFAAPNVAGMAAMIIWGRRSDRSGERIWHIVSAWLFAAGGFAVASMAQNHALVLIGLSCAIVGALAAFGPFYSLPSSYLTGAAAAGSIALVNAISTLGGFVAPTMIGIIKQDTGSYSAAFAALATALMLAALIVVALGRAMPLRRVIPQAGAGDL